MKFSVTSRLYSLLYHGKILRDIIENENDRVTFEATNFILITTILFFLSFFLLNYIFKYMNSQKDSQSSND